MTTGTVLSGLLKDFGLVEVLQVVELGGMTGAIHLKQSTGRMGILYFNDGKLANCSEIDPGALTLGDILQQLGMATRFQLEEAFHEQLHDPFGKRIGERLMMKGAISEQQLQEALRTKTLWTARELALWQDGTYEFITSPNIQKLLPYGEAVLDIEVMRVTMEMVRYSDEWQELTKFLPLGMRTTVQMYPAIPFPMRFDLRTLELLAHVNLYHKVRRVAGALRRPELDVARDMVQFIQHKLLQVPPQQEVRAHSDRKLSLPSPAEKLRLENFQMLDLISYMEQEWDKKRTPMEQLPALVEFVNLTMEALADACHKNGTELDPNTLRALMINERLNHLGDYEFKVEQNHVDIESFTALCNMILRGDIKQAEEFYNAAIHVLYSLLCRIFEAINARVVNPRERLENQEVWEAMFEQFALRSSTP